MLINTSTAKNPGSSSWSQWFDDDKKDSLVLSSARDNESMRNFQSQRPTKQRKTVSPSVASILKSIDSDYESHEEEDECDDQLLYL